MLFVLTFLLQEMTWASQRKMIVLSCWGPGATLPSCRFKEGRRLAAPETCSACAHTGSPSTGTSTTTRWAKERACSVPSECSWRRHTCRRGGAGASCCTSLWKPRWGHRPAATEHGLCVCVLAFSKFQLEGFPYSFLFKTFRVFQESLKWEMRVSVCSSTFCPLSCRCVYVFSLLPPDVCVHSSVRFSHQRTGQ